MQCNQAGIDLIKLFEGCELCSYQDQGGIWTVGYGQTGPFVTPDMKITQYQADMWLMQQVQMVAAALSRIIKTPLNENEFSALCSWAYNIGIGNAASSRAIALIKQGNIELAGTHLMLWNKVNGQIDPGLVRRRAAELALFNTPVSS